MTKKVTCRGPGETLTGWDPRGAARDILSILARDEVGNKLLEGRDDTFHASPVKLHWRHRQRTPAKAPCHRTNAVPTPSRSRGKRGGNVTCAET